MPRRLCQNQPGCPRSLRICHPSCPPDEEEEEGQVLDSVILHLLLDNTRPTTFLGDNIQTLEKHESRATLRNTVLPFDRPSKFFSDPTAPRRSNVSLF